MPCTTDANLSVACLNIASADCVPMFINIHHGIERLAALVFNGCADGLKMFANGRGACSSGVRHNPCNVTGAGFQRRRGILQAVR